jgi:hypothetical protein
MLKGLKSRKEYRTNPYYVISDVLWFSVSVKEVCIRELTGVFDKVSVTWRGVLVKKSCDLDV